MKSAFRILTVLQRDLLAAGRDFILVYMLFGPLLLALILRLVIPVASDATIRLVVDASVDRAAAEQMTRYATVERVADQAALDRRVMGPDDALGVLQEAGVLTLRMEGNEASSVEQFARLVIGAVSHPDGSQGPLLVSATDRGEGRSPLRTYSGASVLLLAAMLGGLIAGLSVIEEKEGRMLTVLAVTPLGKAEYFAGKSLIGVVVPMVQAALLVPLMGLAGVNVAQLLFMMLCAAITSLVLGFFVGAVSPSQIAGIANIKFMFLVISGSFLGALLVPEAWRWALYWSPFYWSTVGFVAILDGVAAWPALLMDGLITVALSGALFVALAGRIRRALAPVGV